MVPPSKLISGDKLFLSIQSNEIIWIDVRSQSEFAEDHIPGAINLPVLDDLERKEVGTIYKQNPFSAKQYGARLISKNISTILFQIETILKDKFTNQNDLLRLFKEQKFCIYCWRGGMRSRSLYTVMDMIGYKTFLLEGGYKTFRAKVNEYINNESLPEFYVLYGPSGTGKTELLARLKNDSFGVLELEKYANHKGSLLGAEKEAQPSQKLFETNLAIAMLLNDSKPFWILEGESVKIGKLSIPQRIYKKMRAARKIWIELPLDVRASRIAIDYTAPDEELIHKLGYLKQYMGSETIQEIISHVKNKDRKQAAFMLLEKHYDHYYQRNFNPEMPDSNFVKTIREDDIEVIYTSLKDFLKQQN